MSGTSSDPESTPVLTTPSSSITSTPGSITTATSATDSQEWTTSTVFTTTTYTITSCAPTVTNCPGKGHVVTETIPLYTTVCPVTRTAATETKTPAPVNTNTPAQPETIVTKVTKVYTITSCAPTVTNCPVGQLTTEVVTSTHCPGCDKNINTKVTPPASTTKVTYPANNSTMPAVTLPSGSLPTTAPGPSGVHLACGGQPCGGEGAPPLAVTPPIKLDCGGQPCGGETMPATAGASGKPVSTVFALLAGLMVTAMLL